MYSEEGRNELSTRAEGWRVDTGNTLRKQRKKNAMMVMDSLTWEMQQGRVFRVSTEVS